MEKAIGDRKYEEAVEISKAIEDEGYFINLVLDDKVVYISDEYEVNLKDIIVYDVDEIVIDEPLETYIIRSNLGEFNSIKLGDESSISSIRIDPIISIEEQNNLFKEDRQFTMKLILMVLLAIIGSVVLTTSLATYITVGSIIKPLELLQTGTNKIMAGDLNFSLNYDKDDAFGEVFSDFENMRKKLLDLRDHQVKYNENRKELIAGITHDLNTPLTSIRGYTSGLLDGIAKTEEKQVYYLEKINSISTEMSGLVNELLDYSMLDIDSVNFNFVKTDLVEYFKDCILELEKEYDEKGMKIEFYAEIPDKVAYSYIDLIHFRRVVLNIFNNSLKYKEKDLGHLLITLYEKNNFYSISFKDDGIGITRDEVKKIFEVFYRLDKSRNKEIGGYGLGLAIVKNIVSAHSGYIEINKDYNEGLELILTLPKV